MTLSLRLSYASIGLGSSESCHFETREVTPHSRSGYFASPRMTLAQSLFRESQNDTFTAIKLTSSESCHFETREVTPTVEAAIFASPRHFHCD